MSLFKKIDIGAEALLEAYKRGISLTDMLEKEDPSENYGPQIKLDAFERQLAARGLEINNLGSSVTLDAFYEESNRILFPEFIDRNIRMGLLMGKNAVKIEDLIYTTTEIDAGTYQNAIVDMTSKPKLKKVGEGAGFPTVKLSLNDKTIYLGKYGRKILATYEYRRRIKANVFATILQFIGMALAEDLANMGVRIIIEGTGNSDAAGEVEYTAVDYNNLVDFDLEFDPYDCDLLVGPKTMIGSILKLAEFKDPMVGFDYQKTGRWMTPLGKTLKRSGASELSTNKMLGLDSRFCLEKVIERGSSLTETDKIIDGQWDEIVISMVIGFAKTFTEAGKVWKPAS